MARFRMHRHDATIFGLALLVLLFQFAAGAPAQTAQKQSKKSTATDANVDLNTASEKDLETLPGVGAATAKKIIAARPYSSVDELSKSGIPASTIKKITPLVTVSGSSANSNATNSQPSSAETAPAPSRKSSSKSTSAPPSSTSQSSQPQGNPGPGMVWVNLDSGVYHYQGSHYYGKTKNGKYMSESEAISAGYRAAKNEKKPQ